MFDPLPHPAKSGMLETDYSPPFWMSLTPHTSVRGLPQYLWDNVIPLGEQCTMSHIIADEGRLFSPRHTLLKTAENDTYLV